MGGSSSSCMASCYSDSNPDFMGPGGTGSFPFLHCITGSFSIVIFIDTVVEIGSEINFLLIFIFVPWKYKKKMQHISFYICWALTGKNGMVILVESGLHPTNSARGSLNSLFFFLDLWRISTGQRFSEFQNQQAFCQSMLGYLLGNPTCVLCKLCSIAYGSC